MAGNRKPRKQYRGAARHVPMMADTHNAEALRLHMTVSGFIAQPSVDLFNELTRKLAAVSESTLYLRKVKDIVGARDRVANALRTLTLTLNGIAERVALTKVLSCRDDEATSLRTTAEVLDEAIAKIPANVFKEAKAAVAFMK